ATSAPRGEVVQRYAFTLDPTGRRTEIAEGDGTARSYTYDGLDRLTGETVRDGAGALAYRNDFAYDPVGNRLEQGKIAADGSTRTISYDHDSRDRLLEVDGARWSWDAGGQLTDRAGNAAASYQWDFDGRLVKATLADGTVVEHDYDADGNRVSTRLTPPGGPTAETHYLVDSAGELSHVVAELDAADNPTARYLRADDELLAVIREGATRYIHADGIGSIRALTDEAGAVTDRYAYSAFGEPLAHDGADPQPYRFAGEPYDTSSGFAYHRARWMDPSAGRFASMDPWGGSPFDPASLHRYTYAANDPVLVVDPTGRMTVTEALVVVGARIAAMTGALAPVGAAALRQSARGLAALKWTETALQRLGAHIKQAQVLLEEAVHGSRGRIDLVVSRGADKVTRIGVELKGWNLDRIARGSETFRQSMLQKLEDQATRFVQGQGLGKTYDELVYGFSTAPITRAGQIFFDRAMKVLEKAGVVRDNIAVGADNLIKAVEKLI
ncbi:MAG: hypothetical protein HYV63_15595, partial [Candidatus Schekmanbacteria bacterium]|nr:hypothetical protein [Candidatus Schekmanbacteria bacterium]